MNVSPVHSRDLGRMALAVLIAFALAALSAAYWGVLRAEDLRARDDNARSVLAEQRIARGAILDRTGEPLALSEQGAGGLMVRRYPHPAAASAVGYYSLTYGTAGIEAAYDGVLRGDEGRGELDTLLDELLHRSPAGSDVRATLDLGVQEAVVAALEGRAGAAVVLDAATGGVLALASLPGYDPNVLDAQWDALAADRAASPLLNRATAGLYQPGGAFQTVVLTALLGAQSDLSDGGERVLSRAVEEGSAPVAVNGLTLECASTPAGDVLTLLDAYAFGCPAAFAAVFDAGLTADLLWERLRVLGLLNAPALDGFETAAARSAQPGSAASDAWLALLTGQGGLTVSPLQVAQLAAAIANGGNAMPPHLVDAVRKPEASDWQAVTGARQPAAMLRAEVARALERAMGYAAGANPATQQAQGDGYALFGHSALAYAGPDETPYAWFVGFARSSEGQGAGTTVAVVIVEDERDPAVAARIAGAAFAAAYEG
ncbi:MAG: penicillin-binding transpeptidase domain-containing protein [Anaerolineae bacterium]|nr:penicillin-binding transpeptidase domain-containing protein [Anaerolineae bacterium]